MGWALENETKTDRFLIEGGNLMCGPEFLAPYCWSFFLTKKFDRKDVLGFVGKLKIILKTSWYFNAMKLLHITFCLFDSILTTDLRIGRLEKEVPWNSLCDRQICRLLISCCRVTFNSLICSKLIDEYLRKQWVEIKK